MRRGERGGGGVRRADAPGDLGSVAVAAAGQRCCCRRRSCSNGRVSCSGGYWPLLLLLLLPREAAWMCIHVGQEADRGKSLLMLLMLLMLLLLWLTGERA